MTVLLLGSAAGGYYVSMHTLTTGEVTQAASCIKVGSAEHGEMIWIPGGEFIMGNNHTYPEERPETTRQVDGFWISKHEISNAQFAEFVQATGHVTTAEKQLNPDDYPQLNVAMPAPGSVVFIMPTDIKSNGSLTQWWQFVSGANWRHPTGPRSDIIGKENHPVVHISHADAQAYANWRGHSLPTEKQWEYAARFGENSHAVKQGIKQGERWQANIWQGIFPITNLASDGYPDTAPVGCFPANAAGLHDMLGNVWEWTSDAYYPTHALTDNNLRQAGFDPRQPGVQVNVIKGGSYLCADNYCLRYRPSARHAQETGLGTGHLGFRTVRQ